MTPEFEMIQRAIRNGMFTPPKPKNEQTLEDVAIIEELDSQKKLMIQQKDDGNGYIDVIGKNSKDIELYTLGLAVATPKYPHIVTSLQELCLPDQTVISSEISITVKGVQKRSEIGRLNTSSIENALDYQRRMGFPEISLFTILMWNGENVSKWSNRDRYDCLAEHVAKKKKRKRSDYARMTEILKMSLAEARVFYIEQKWEGLVLYDADAPTKFLIGDIESHKRPEIPRPYGVWKDKIPKQVDFVAYDFKKSTAPTHFGAVKDFYIGLIDPHTGAIIPCGKCGIGLSKDERFAFAKPKALPIAVEVTFENWSEHGKTLLGKITGIRDPQDKHYLQCCATEEQLPILSTDRINPPWL